jgi:hypothetical protein
MSKYYIVYSHGFGVRKDDRGLFTDIAKSLGDDFEHIMFDYNTFNELTKNMIVEPLDTQAEKLKSQIEKLNIQPEDTLDIIAHSQGCIVAARANISNVNQIIFVTPPDSIDVKRMKNFFGNRPGSIVNDQEFITPRRDGTTTTIPKRYWEVAESIENLNRNTRKTFYVASDDEVLGVTDFSDISKFIDLEVLPGNHDFTGEYRKELIKSIVELLVNK